MTLPDLHFFTVLKVYAVETVSFIVFMVWLFRIAYKEIFKGKGK